MSVETPTSTSTCNLMTENEKYHFGDFKTHKEAEEEHVKKIEKLRIDFDVACLLFSYSLALLLVK